MRHLHMWSGSGHELDSRLCHYYADEEQFFTQAQQWATELGVPVSVEDYEGHENREDGETVASFEPEAIT